MLRSVVMPFVGTYVDCSRWLCDNGCSFLAPHERVLYKQWRSPNGKLFTFQPCDLFVRKVCPCLWDDVNVCYETHASMLRELPRFKYDAWCEANNLEQASRKNDDFMLSSNRDIIHAAVKEAAQWLENKLPAYPDNTKRDPANHLWECIERHMGKRYSQCSDDQVNIILQWVKHYRDYPC